MYDFPERAKCTEGEEEEHSIWGQIINLANGDLTKTDYVLYEESYANLVMYASAMPRYDDIKKTTQEAPKDTGKMNFSQFLDAMAAIKEQHG